MSQAVEPSPQCPTQQVTRSGLRKDDPLDQLLLPPLRKPVYILLQDHERAQRLAQQLEFFG
ncbi:MAG: diguanylate cyclase response regulator, partial [Pseudomonas putida]